VRAWIARHHGYDKYPGNCPMATNHAAVLMALALGGDDFQQSLTIAASAGWDTDCNAGNVGCLNAIRLGLDAIDAGAPFRPAMADQMYVVSADGGECLTDAVLEARKIIHVAATLRGESVALPPHRFAFEQRGSVQGWTPHPIPATSQALASLENSRSAPDSPNARSSKDSPGLIIRYSGLARGRRASLSVKTFVDPEPKGQKGTSYFEVIASPSLYATQTVRASLLCPEGPAPALRFFIDHYDGDGELQTLSGPVLSLAAGENLLTWEVPDTGGHPIYRLGIDLLPPAAGRLDGALTLQWLDWAGAPRAFSMGKSMAMSPTLTPWTTVTPWLTAFVSSARNFAPDYTATFSISHREAGGVVTLGTRDWADYSVGSRITFSQQQAAGLVARARGHRRYYAALLVPGKAQIVKQQDDRRIVLAEAALNWAIDETRTLHFALQGERLVLHVDGVPLVSASDGDYPCGGAGFLVDEGAILADGFHIHALPTPPSEAA